MVFCEFFVHAAELRDGNFHYLRQERTSQAQLPSVTNGAADDPAQDVAPALVARHHPVADQKCGSTGVLDHHPHGVVGLGFGSVGLAGQLADPVDDGNEQVGLVDVVLTLENDHRPFQTHAGIDGRGWQRRPVASGVLVVLHEHQVPQFHKAFAVAVWMAAVDRTWFTRFQLLSELGGQVVRRNHPAVVTALLRAAIEVDLGAGAGWSFVASGAPPVIFVAVAVDPFLRNAHLVAPDGEGLFIIQMDCYIEPFRVQLE